MKEGDLVWGWLTEQIGIVVGVGEAVGSCRRPVKVMWTTQGHSLFPPGGTEWTDPRGIEPLEARNEDR